MNPKELDIPIPEPDRAHLFVFGCCPHKQMYVGVNIDRSWLEDGRQQIKRFGPEGIERKWDCDCTPTFTLHGAFVNQDNLVTFEERLVKEDA